MTKKKKAEPQLYGHYRPHARVTTPVIGATMTKESEAAATDVNNIVRKYDRTGLITHLQAAEGVYADVSELGSYQDAVNNVKAAETAFLALPSGLRSHFNNNPAAYVDWAASASLEDREALYAEITGVDRYAEPENAPSPPAPANPPEPPASDPA